MKVLFFAFLALAVGANAYPYELEGDIENTDARGPIEDAIRDTINGVSQWMRDSGLDPLQVERLRIENTPQPGVDIELAIDGMHAMGGSDIVIHRLNYNLFSNRMQLDCSLPAIRMSVRDLLFSLNLDGTKYTARGSGDFTMLSLRITTDINFSVSIIGGVSMRRVLATLRIQHLWSDINLVINGVDYSGEVNDMINDKIPEFMRENQRAIDEAMSRVIYELGNYILSR